jgi:hypothetical protein
MLLLLLSLLWRRGGLKLLREQQNREREREYGKAKAARKAVWFIG